MPTITLSKKALLASLTTNLSDDELKDRISFLGTDLEGVSGDEITVEIFPNRPDLLSQQGFNRAFASFIGDKPGLKQYSVKKAGRQNRVIIHSSVKSVRPYTACALVKGVRFTDETIKDVIQIQEKLHVTYGRHRKRCAIGIYPLEHIKLPITYVAKKPEDIVFTPLGASREMNGLQILSQHPTGREYGHLLEGYKRFPVFIDAKGDVLSMPPIINSELTGRITESTRDVFIECSGFSWHVVHGALAIIVSALADMGGVIEEMVLEYPDVLGGKRRSPQLTPWKLPFAKSYVENYLGYRFSTREVKRLLSRMGIGCVEGRKKDELVALIPAYRVDIIHPIDLVEDIAIAYGTDKVEAVIPRVATIAEESPLEVFTRKVREVLIGHGLLEIKNYGITSRESQTTSIGHDDEDPVMVVSSASSEYDTLRSRLLPSGLLTLKRNKQYEYPQNVFEIGVVFSKDESWETGVREESHLSVVLCGEDAHYTQIRQVLDSLLGAFALEAVITPVDDPLFLKGRAGVVSVHGESLGVIGEVSPAVLERFELLMPVAAFEISLDLLHSVVSRQKDSW